MVFSAPRSSRLACLVTFAALLSLGVAPGASGQCTSNDPVTFAPDRSSSRPTVFAEGYSNAIAFYSVSGEGRLILSENYGYGTYSLSNPGSPRAMAYHDFLPNVPQRGDGQSRIGMVAAAPDGSRAVVGWTTSEHTNFLMKPSSSTFWFGGEFGNYNASSIAVVKRSDGRYLGFMTATFMSGVKVADVSTFKTDNGVYPYTSTNPNPVVTPNSVPSETLPGTSGSTGWTAKAAGDFLLAFDGSVLLVFDASAPVLGSTGSLASAFQGTQLTAVDFGGASSQFITGLAAAPDPTNSKKLQLMAVLGSATAGLVGFGVATLDGTNPSSPVVNPDGRVGVFVPAAPYSGSSGRASAAVGVQYGSDVAFAFFVVDSGTGIKRLFAGQRKQWPAVSAVKDIAQNEFEFAFPSQIVGTSNSSNFFIYTAEGLRAHAFTLACTAATAPATATLAVSRCTDASNDSTCTSTLTDNGSTPAVFVGDRLKIATNVSPIPSTGSSSALADWRIDLDYHSASEGASTFPRLSSPDLSLTGQGTLPGSFYFVGPCDPRNGSPSYSNATTNDNGCWTSVIGNTSTGGNPDFASSVYTVAQEGNVVPLPLGFEAANQLGSQGLSTFTVRWTIPRVRLKASQVLKQGTLTDGSDGQPATTGYKWYLAAAPGVPAGTTPLELQSCTGSSCTLPSTMGKGTYEYWLTVPYRNGYRTEDCPQGTDQVCSRSRGTITITDVIPGLSVPTSTTKTIGKVTVTNTTQTGGGIYACPGFKYDLCDATAGGGSCSAGSYPNSLSFSGSSADLTLPTADTYPRTYWLRARYQYAYDSGCTSPVNETWYPTSPVSGDSTAVAITVTNVLYSPQVRVFTNGVDPCAGGGAGPGGSGSGCGSFAAKVNDSLNAWAYDSVTNAAIPDNAGSFVWNFGSTATPVPSSSSGNGASFRYAAAGSPTVTLTFTPSGGSASTYTASGSITVNAVPVTAAASASVGSAAQNQAVTFTAQGYGGTGSYTYTWAFSDGGSASGQIVSHSFASLGTQTGTVTVRDTNNAAASASAYVTITSSVPTYNLSITVLVNGVDPCASSGGGGGAGPGGGLLACAFSVKSNEDTLTAIAYNNGTELTSGTYLWTFGGASATPTTGNYNRFPFKYLTTGTGVVGLTWTPSGGSPVSASAVTFSVIQGGPPPVTVTASATPATVYTNAVVTFTATATGGSGSYTAYWWDFGDNFGLAGATQTHAYSAVGTYTAKVSVADSTGAVGVRTVTVVVTTPPLPPMWMVPGVAYVDGQNGALWQSDLSIFNPDRANPMDLKIAFLNNTIAALSDLDAKWISLRIQPNETRTYRNVLQKPFQLAKGAAGAILVQHKDYSPVYLPVMSARTYDAGRGASGTVGLSLQVVSLQSSSSSSGGGAGPGGVRPAEVGPAATNGTYDLIGLSDDEESHTNLGLANLQGDSVTVEVTFRDPSRAALGIPVVVNLGPYGFQSLTDVLTRSAGYAGPGVHSYRASVRLVKGTAILPYASVIDRQSNAPALLTPPNVASSAYRVPGIVRVQGQNNTVWRSDLVLYNPSTLNRLLKITYAFVKSGDPTNKLRSYSLYFQMYAGEIVEWDDFVKYWLELPDTDTAGYVNSYVDIVPFDGNTDPILVTGRTYNNQPTGKVGLGVPGFTSADAASRTGANKRLVLTGLRADAEYRSNVAFLLASATEQTTGSVGATAKVYDVSGTLIATKPFGLDPLNPVTQFSIDDMVAGASIDMRSGMSVVVEELTGTGLIAGYSTVIDRTSGGSTLSPAQPVP